MYPTSFLTHPCRKARLYGGLFYFQGRSGSNTQAAAPNLAEVARILLAGQWVIMQAHAGGDDAPHYLFFVLCSGNNHFADLVVKRLAPELNSRRPYENIVSNAPC